jgi:hypothetical protein
MVTALGSCVKWSLVIRIAQPPKQFFDFLSCMCPAVDESRRTGHAIFSNTGLLGHVCSIGKYASFFLIDLSHIESLTGGFRSVPYWLSLRRVLVEVREHT